MKKYFVTCNTNKFNEIKSYISDIEQLCVENSIEVQSLDSKYIIREKLFDAKEKTNIKDGIIIVEDTGLYLKAMNNFPGPLIKFILKAIQTEGIYKLCKALNKFDATAKTVFGMYNVTSDSMQFFEGMTEGKISSPKGSYGFGWDPIFIPKGSVQTFAEMNTIEEKNRYSMRYKSISLLTEHLSKKQS